MHCSCSPAAKNAALWLKDRAHFPFAFTCTARAWLFLATHPFFGMQENIYLLALAGERYRVRRVPDKGRLLQVGGKRQRSRDSSQRDMPGSRRAARSTGIPADATRSASDLHDTRSDLPMRLVPAGVHQPSVAQRAQQPRIRTDQEERHAADERPSCAPPVSSTGSGRHVVLDVVEPPTTDSTAHGAADGDFPHPAHGGDLHSERRSLPGEPGCHASATHGLPCWVAKNLLRGRVDAIAVHAHARRADE